MAIKLLTPKVSIIKIELMLKLCKHTNASATGVLEGINLYQIPCLKALAVMNSALKAG